MGRDVFEYIPQSNRTSRTVRYQAMEFHRTVMEEMSIDGRLKSMCCLSVCTGAKTGIVNPEPKIFDWF